MILVDLKYGDFRSWVLLFPWKSPPGRPLKQSPQSGELVAWDGWSPREGHLYVLAFHPAHCDCCHMAVYPVAHAVRSQDWRSAPLSLPVKNQYPIDECIEYRVCRGLVARHHANEMMDG